MAETDDKKFYWIKLKTDFFGDHSPMDFLLGQPNGSEYVCLYIKLCLATANTDGKLCDRFGEMLIPYDINKIQRDMKFFSIDTVRVALTLYQQLGLVYEEIDGILAITNYSEIVGSETKWAKYKRGEIGNKLENFQSNSNFNLENVQQEIRDKENRDKDIKDMAKPQHPTLLDIENFIKEKGYQVDAERFFNYYEKRGWRAGKNPVADWKDKIKEWDSKEKKKSNPNQFNNFQKSETDYAKVRWLN